MFVRIDLERQFQPREGNRTYGMSRLIDMRQFPLARAITFYVVADSEVDNILTVRVVGNDGPDPGGGVVNIGGDQVTIANKFTKLAFSLSIVAAPFPYYGITVTTAVTPPTKGRTSVYADLWWGD